MSDDTQEKQARINKELRDTHVKLPQKTDDEWMRLIKAKIAKDPPKASEDRPFAGGGLLFQTYQEPRLPHASNVAIQALTPNVTVTGDDPMAKAVGKLGILCSDLHDEIFPAYMRARIMPLELIDDYGELQDTNLVITRNCAMSFSPDTSGIYGVGTKPFDFRQFRADMKYLGHDVDLELLPPCPIRDPEAFHTWMKVRKLSRSADILLTETNEQTDIKDYYAAWSLYKSFKFHGGTEEQPFDAIAFAGCTWTCSRPTREYPAIVMSVCRFDPVAFFFEDRQKIIEPYLDIRRKRAKGQDPVPPVQASPFAFTHGDTSNSVDPTGLSLESVQAAAARLQAAGNLGFEITPDMTEEEYIMRAQREGMKIAVNATLDDVLGKR